MITPKRRGPSQPEAPPPPALQLPLCQLHSLLPVPADGGPGELNVPHRCCHQDVSRTRALKSTARVRGDPGGPEGPWSGAHSSRRSETEGAGQLRSRASLGMGTGPGAAGHGRAHTRAHTRASFNPSTPDTCGRDQARGPQLIYVLGLSGCFSVAPSTALRALSLWGWLPGTRCPADAVTLGITLRPPPAACARGVWTGVGVADESG